MRMVSLSLVSLVALTACGSMKKGGAEEQKLVVTEEAAKAQSQSLPAVTIVRVPVDASGKEVHDKAEMKLSNDKNIAAANVESVFAKAEAPQTFVNELDQSSSTESFHGWRSRCRVRCNGGFNSYSNTNYNNYNYNNYNYNNYSYNDYNWSMYRPTYYYGGYYYNWNYAQTYQYSGYNYYTYNSSFNQSYSGYGVAPGYYY